MAKVLYNIKAFEDTGANLATDETIYPKNSFIFNTTTGTFKRGNGVDTYADLTEEYGAEAAVSLAVTAHSASGLAAAANLQALAQALSARIKALEDAE